MRRMYMRHLRGFPTRSCLQPTHSRQPLPTEVRDANRGWQQLSPGSGFSYPCPSAGRLKAPSVCPADLLSVNNGPFPIQAYESRGHQPCCLLRLPRGPAASPVAGLSQDIQRGQAVSELLSVSLHLRCLPSTQLPVPVPAEC